MKRNEKSMLGPSRPWGGTTRIGETRTSSGRWGWVVLGIREGKTDGIQMDA